MCVSYKEKRPLSTLGLSSTPNKKICNFCRVKIRLQQNFAYLPNVAQHTRGAE